MTKKNPTVEVAKEQAVDFEDREMTLQTGVEVRLLSVSASLIMDVQNHIKYPDVPFVIDEESGKKYENPNHLRNASWHIWQIALEDFSNVDLTNVKKIYIGFGDRDNHPSPGGSGLLYFDDFRLYKCRPGTLAGDSNGDCVIDFRDFAIVASEWLCEGSL